MRVPCRLVLAPLAAMLFAAALPAQDNTELLNRMKAMEDRIHALEAEVQTLKGQPAAAAVVTASRQPPPVAAAPVVQPAPADARSVWAAPAARRPRCSTPTSA